MSDQTRDYPLGDILSVTSRYLVSRDGMSGVYRILAHLTGDDVYTHQLPDAAAFATPGILAQHPQLTGVAPAGELTPDQARAWLTVQEQRFGVSLPLAPVPGWGVHDPIQELVDRFGPDRVVPVVIADGAR